MSSARCNSLSTSATRFSCATHPRLEVDDRRFVASGDPHRVDVGETLCSSRGRCRRTGVGGGSGCVDECCERLDGRLHCLPLRHESISALGECGEAAAGQIDAPADLVQVLSERGPSRAGRLHGPGELVEFGAEGGVFAFECLDLGVEHREPTRDGPRLTQGAFARPCEPRRARRPLPRPRLPGPRRAVPRAPTGRRSRR